MNHTVETRSVGAKEDSEASKPVWTWTGKGLELEQRRNGMMRMIVFVDLDQREERVPYGTRFNMGGLIRLKGKKGARTGRDSMQGTREDRGQCGSGGAGCAQDTREDCEAHKARKQCGSGGNNKKRQWWIPKRGVRRDELATGIPMRNCCSSDREPSS